MLKVIFKEEMCKGCGLCIEVCPMKVISLGDKINVNGYKSAIISEDKASMCIGCVSCAKACPHCAITVEEHKTYV